MIKPIIFKNNNYIFESDKKEISYFKNNIIIKTVENKKDFNDFYRVPWEVYNKDKYWIPLLWNELDNFFKKNNHFWSHSKTKLFLAIKNQKIVGRIAVFIDTKYCKIKKNKIGFFGFFECINDNEIASNLFKSAEKWLSSLNIKKIIGPVDGRVDMGCGFVYKGFDKPSIFPDKYSPSYYIDLVEKFNMKKSRDFFNYYIDLKKPIPKELEIAAKKCEDEYKIKIRNFDKKRSGKEIEWWSDFMIQTFTDHWGYIPVKNDEIKERYGIKNIRWFLDKKLFLIAEKNGIPIGFSWTFPDYNQIFKNMSGTFNFIDYLKFYYNVRKINQANMNIIGINKEYQKKGIASLLNFNTITELKKRGYTAAEIGVADEYNIPSQKIIKKTGAVPHKIFRVYEKIINI